MSLLLLEGFDTGDWTQRANAVGSMSVDTGIKRTGYASAIFNANFDVINWLVPTGDRHATFVAGLGVYFTVASQMAFMSLLSDNVSVTHGQLTRGATGTVRVNRGDGTLLGESVATPLTLNTWHYVEFSYTVHDTAGAFAVRVNGVEVLTGSGVDTRNGGNGLLDTLYLVRPGGGSTWYADDIYLCNGAGTVNNSFLGPIAVEALYPSGNGTYSQLVGSDGDSVDNYLLVDDAPDPSGTDYVGSPTDGNKDTYLFADLAAGSAVIPGVEVRMWAARSDANPKSIRRVHRRGGVDSVGADRALTTTYDSYEEVIELDPSDGAAWTVAKVNASEWGAEVRP